MVVAGLCLVVFGLFVFCVRMTTGVVIWCLWLVAVWSAFEISWASWFWGCVICFLADFWIWVTCWVCGLAYVVLVCV